MGTCCLWGQQCASVTLFTIKVSVIEVVLIMHYTTLISNLLGLGMGAWLPTTRASRASEMLLNSKSPLELLSAEGESAANNLCVLCARWDDFCHVYAVCVDKLNTKCFSNIHDLKIILQTRTKRKGSLHSLLEGNSLMLLGSTTSPSRKTCFSVSSSNPGGVLKKCRIWRGKQ